MTSRSGSGSVGGDRCPRLAVRATGRLACRGCADRDAARITGTGTATYAARSAHPGALTGSPVRLHEPSLLLGRGDRDAVIVLVIDVSLEVELEQPAVRGDR